MTTTSVPTLLAAVHIAVDGTATRIDLATGADGSVLHALYAALGVRWVDCVALTGRADMWVDDEGMIVAEPIVNQVATYLVHTMRDGGATQAYYGPAVITGGVDDDGTTVGLDDATAKLVLGHAADARAAAAAHGFLQRQA